MGLDLLGIEEVAVKFVVWFFVWICHGGERQERFV
jgi:hypothetical protein